jgi:predicted metalloprotease
MNALKLALMAAGAWWLWTLVDPYIAARLVPYSEPARGTSPRTGDFFETLFGNINNEWSQMLPGYRKPRLVLFDGQTRSSCTMATARSPFYCPPEGAIYLSPQFAREVSCSGSACGFALAVVLAHEVGHHVQNLTGIDRGGSGGPGLELQADCLAGVWAKHEDERLRREGKPALVEPGDIETAVRMAGQFGDGGSHGSGPQRQHAFSTGWQGGTPASCMRGGVS